MLSSVLRIIAAGVGFSTSRTSTFIPNKSFRTPITKWGNQLIPIYLVASQADTPPINLQFKINEFDSSRTLITTTTRNSNEYLELGTAISIQSAWIAKESYTFNPNTYYLTFTISSDNAVLNGVKMVLLWQE